ncbi:flavodoxin family protein [Spirochaeta isovalerica]|uniref:Flavodoxin n=1 Tax=Spirochaeta isovalerica TaxID=150 RepID=A0A841RDI7_9SPIO|nr:flavodoxin family protein [Spirochaeta isovalerica]MBB6481297.1 flavodoxin [Spirochaeta isovalerica]
MKEVLIVYFSGTGCTRLVAETFHRLLGKRGIQSSLRELRHDSGDTFSEYERLVICFPVHACNAPEPELMKKDRRMALGRSQELYS